MLQSALLNKLLQFSNEILLPSMKFYKSRTTSSDRTNTHHKHWKSDLIMTQEIKKKKQKQKKFLLFKKYLNRRDWISIRLHQNPLTLPAVRNSKKNLYIHLNLGAQKVKIIFHLLQKQKKLQNNRSFHQSKNLFTFPKSTEKETLTEKQHWIGGTVKRRWINHVGNWRVTPTNHFSSSAVKLHQQ